MKSIALFTLMFPFSIAKADATFSEMLWQKQFNADFPETCRINDKGDAYMIYWPKHSDANPSGFHDHVLLAHWSTEGLKSKDPAAAPISTTKLQWVSGDREAAVWKSADGKLIFSHKEGSSGWNPQPDINVVEDAASGLKHTCN